MVNRSGEHPSIEEKKSDTDRSVLSPTWRDEPIVEIKAFRSCPSQEELEEEIKYSDGVTPLFVSIEETRWSDALEIAETHPEQLRVWILSSGQDNFFSWRRLPIHEACRRQAPAWLISAFLSAFPESASRATQFGELPLHLAVECGATPEVVNLLVVAYWDGIVATDNSGRTPVEMINTSELLEQEDHRVVFESLERCYTAYTNFQEEAHDAMVHLKGKHKEHVSKIMDIHDQDMAVEAKKQQEYEDQISELKSTISELQNQIILRDRKIGSFSAEEKKWMDRVKILEGAVAKSRSEVKNEQEHVMALVDMVDEKDGEIMKRDQAIQILSNDLAQISMYHDSYMAESLDAAERTMRAMVSSQVALQNQLHGHAKKVKNLLNQRGIPLPGKSGVGKSPKGNGKRVKVNDGFVDANEAANAAVAAAVAALQQQQPPPSNN